MTLLEKYIAKVGESHAVIVKEFADKLIDIGINNEPLRGCVTTNQIIETREDFWAHTHQALSDIQSLLPELIKEVREEFEKILIAELPKEDEQGREKIKDLLASLAEPNIK